MWWSGGGGEWACGSDGGVRQGDGRWVTMGRSTAVPVIKGVMLYRISNMHEGVREDGIYTQPS